MEGPPRFEPEPEETQPAAPSQPPTPPAPQQPAPPAAPADPKGAEDTGYQPAPEPPSMPQPSRAPASPINPTSQLPPLRATSSATSSGPIRNNPLPDEDEEQIVEVSGAPLLVGIGAILVAILALLIALGVIDLGQNSKLIESNQLASGSVGNSQLANEAVTLDKVSGQTVEELRGRQGPEGPAGEKGPRGVAGPGLQGLEMINKRVSGSVSASVTASCPGSKIAISGGATANSEPGKVALTTSQPTSTEDGWLARATAIVKKPGAWSLTVYAWCAKDPRL